MRRWASDLNTHRGIGSIEENSEGSLVSRSVDDPALGTFITQGPLKLEYDLGATWTAVDAPSDWLLWANGDCWSTRSHKFNTAGTDRPVTHIKEWYSVGRPDLCLNDSNPGVRVYSAGGPYRAMAYFCIAAKNTCEHVNPYDINDALEQVSHCIHGNRDGPRMLTNNGSMLAALYMKQFCPELVLNLAVAEYRYRKYLSTKGVLLILCPLVAWKQRNGPEGESWRPHLRVLINNNVSQAEEPPYPSSGRSRT